MFGSSCARSSVRVVVSRAAEMPSLLQGLEDIPEKLGSGNAEETKTSVGGFYRRGCTWWVGLVS